jgi:hydroxyethylthiazole kinase-like uncharacterized protein yjeF
MSDVPTIDGTALRQHWPLPDPDDADSKHDRGSIIVIGGAASTPGAVLLAGLAALRVGAGRLTIATTASTAAALAVAVPEAAVIGLPESKAGALDEAAVAEAASASDDARAALIGPGLQEPDDTRRFLEELLPQLPDSATVIVDALAITCGAETAIRARADHGQLIVTPNDTEAQRLLGDSAKDRSDADAATMVARHLGAVTVLGSVVARPDGQRWQIPQGNSGLGTSGSGDVLAGAIAGIAARGADAFTASLWGLTAHKSAGDRLAQRVGPVGYLARELLAELPGTINPRL